MEELNYSANNKRNKKIRNLIIICVMSALLLTVGTYAWFIGMQTVKVNEFEVKIASVDSLSLSLDGYSWSTQLDDVVTAGSGVGTNEFLTDDKEGLKPISTIGVFDKDVSRLKLYEKGSLTSTKGGYRLMASRVNNYDEDAKDADGNVLPKYSIADGYVVFDLYVMNLSGDAYYPSITDPSNEEAIYLTYNSAVTAGSTGYSASGIENSVRVAFAQVGRVSATDYYTTANSDEADKAKVNKITGITCNKDNTDSAVTGICRDAYIWEPNDTTHTNAAKEWYEKTCKARRAADSEKGENGNGFYYKDENCAAIANGNGKTNAVAGEIIASNYVDVYDGVYNTYAANTSTALTPSAADTANGLLYQVDTYTDSEKLQTGNQRVEVMTLAPNSITKVRVYIWIEGQDVDNYDFAALGHSISVNFGFTKERFTANEIDNTGGTSSFIAADASHSMTVESLPSSGAATSAAGA